MTDKEKEAIEHFNNLNHLYEIGVDNLKYTESEYDNSKILLNLIKTLKRDFEIVDHECSRLEQEDIKKDMIIDLMAKDIKEADKFLDSMGHLGEYAGYTIEDIIEEYKKEAEYKIKEDK